VKQIKSKIGMLLLAATVLTRLFLVSIGNKVFWNWFYRVQKFYFFNRNNMFFLRIFYGKIIFYLSGFSSYRLWRNFAKKKVF